ncbi:Hypothetical protein SRAE_X000121900 [Strongyloides ratti]|uniref:Uncharacterized protein n=1 Tax=Strongyloides ratti TaxID=34506 RepID=A0A090MN41_STRRB|nr:Hypothetical protein SRAE_X000121900 [Strongyloides ratti]CEF59471.1 Hypothetical protein SRAE_X000121900 [Strongyloides ratti]
MCCCCPCNIHRHQIHLISYGFVALILIITGLVFTIFAIFQKDSQIGKIWLAGPTTMVVGLVLCGKVIIDWAPAMYRGRHNSIDSIFEEQMALMTPRNNKRYVPLTPQISGPGSFSPYIKCQNINCSCPHHIRRSPASYVNTEFTNSTPISIYSHRNNIQDSPSSNSTVGKKSNHNKFNFNHIPPIIGYQENDEFYKKYNHETLSNKSSNIPLELGNNSNLSHQQPISNYRRFSGSLTKLPNLYTTTPSKLSLNIYGNNKLTNNINSNNTKYNNFCNMSFLKNNECRKTKKCYHNNKINEEYDNCQNFEIYTNKQHKVGLSKNGNHQQILSTIKPVSPTLNCINSPYVVTPEPSTIEEESLCNSTFSHNCLCTQEYRSNSQNSVLDLKKEGTSSLYSLPSVVSGNEIVNYKNHSCYQGETFIINEHKYLI